MMIRLGLDVHGVITDDPDFFSNLALLMLEKGHEVYIVTGQENNELLQDTLRGCNIVKQLYKEILSITTYQKALGTPISYLDGRKSQPIMDPEIWNPTKAALCASAGIHIMVDDSEIYGKYFLDVKTQYIRYSPETREFLKLLFYYGGIKL